MGNLVSSIMFFGIFFIVLSTIQYNFAKYYEKLNIAYVFILIVRIVIYMNLIMGKYFLIGFLIVDFFITFILIAIGSSKKAIVATKTIINNCPKCNAPINDGDVYCAECGNKLILDGDQATIESLYYQSENIIINTLIRESASKNDLDINSTLPETKRRKTIISVIFGIITFILTSLIFFHISIIIVVLDILNIIIYILLMKKFNTMKYLIKEVKSRPDENLDYIVSNALANASNAKYLKYIYFSSILIGIIVPLIIFSKPHFFYESTDNGYYVRFYTTTILGENSITVPEEYNGKKVIGIRGNVFMNLKRLKTVSLPDTIEVIRGHAFDGDSSLTSINLPENLNYLGGGAFKNCKSLKNINIPEKLTEINGNTFENTALESIELPDSINDIGGEAFKDCAVLKSVKLPSNITEIHGSTFENCISLESINIPDSVTRIGGHAFYNNTKLSSVTFTANSKLTEIGSSAFRLCNRLSKIVLPKNVISINERAFKESPTTIYYFGEPIYGSIINKNNYKYNSFGYLRKGEEHIVGEFYQAAISHDDRLRLVGIDSYYDKVIYTIEYIGKNETKIVTIDTNNSYSYINENLAIEIQSKYASTNQYSLSFNVYYN